MANLKGQRGRGENIISGTDSLPYNGSRSYPHLISCRFPERHPLCGHGANIYATISGRPSTGDILEAAVPRVHCDLVISSLAIII